MNSDTLKCYTCGVVFDRTSEHKYVNSAECEPCFDKKQDEYYGNLKKKREEEQAKVEEYFRENPHKAVGEKKRKKQ